MSTVSAKICDPQCKHVTGYIHSFLITSLETPRSMQPTTTVASLLFPSSLAPSSPRVLRHPWFLLRVVVVYHGALRGSAGLVPARLNRQPTTGRPSRRRAGASSSRVNERAIACPRQSDKSARAKREGESRGTWCARARSLARGALEESQPLSYHTLRLTPSSVNLDSAPLLRGVLSTDFPAKIDQRRAVSSTPLRLLEQPPLDLLLFFFLLINFRGIKHHQGVS